MAWAASLTIPANCALNVNSCTVVVPGDVSNSGTLQTSTGTISLGGNWINSGTFTAGTGTVVFTKSSGVQTLDTGGLANAFYNLTHTGAGTLQIVNNLTDINNTFTNTAGTFDINNFDLTVGKNWNNTATFLPGTRTVTFDGTNQQILGSTTFYNFTKQVTTADTIKFEDVVASPTGQTVTNYFIMRGAASNLLSIRSTTDGTQAKVKLQAGGAQSMLALDVKDSDASGGPTLVARNSSVDSGNNVNWSFTNVTATWQGADAHAGADLTDWENPFNWDVGLVPAAGDTVIIPATANQPVLNAHVSVGNMTLQTGSSLTTNGYNLVVTTAFSNDGNVRVKGTETLTLTQDTDSGTWTYLGDGNGTSDTRILTINGATALTFFNLVINDANATPANRELFRTNGALTINGNLTVTSGALDTSTNSNAVVIAGNTTVNGGTFTATNSTIDANGDFTLSSGAFTAPLGVTDTAFTLAGNWTNSGGTFTNSSGQLTLDGTNQSLTGTTTFYELRKVVAAAATLTIDAASTITVTNDLKLNGAVGQLLSVLSSAAGTQADLVLTTGATQDLDYLSVRDIDSCLSDTTPCSSGTGLLLVGRHSTNLGNNDHWNFTGATFTWDGSTSTDWDTPSNWDLGTVPVAADNVIIPTVANQPILATNITISGLTVQAPTTILTLNGKNITATGTFSNNGTVIATGAETITMTQDTDSGTWQFVGNNDGTADTRVLTDFGVTDFYNLIINDPNTTKDIFQTNGAFTVNGALTVTAGTLDTSTNSNAVIVNGAISVNGGTWTATNSTIDANSNVTISSGTLTAPLGVTNTTFTVAGNWTHSGGTFTHSSGKVTLDGTNQVMTGDTTFYQLRKVVAAADTLTFAASATQTIVNNLTLNGAAAQLLSLRSSVAATQTNLNLQAGGLQNIQFVDVQDNNATGLMLVGRPDTASSSTQNNTNWIFGAATLTWTGTTDTDWDTPTNWNLGLIPITGDTVIIPSTANQPVLANNISLVDLTLQASTNLTLNGKNITLSGTLSNDGNINATGTETISLTQDINSGTWTYVGNNDGTVDTRTIHDFGATDYYNLVINDSHATKDIFASGAGLVVANNTTVTAGTFTSVNQDLDLNGSLSITTPGIFIAPNNTKTFTLAGSFGNTGTFTPSGGTVIFDTTTTAVISGNTTFDNVKSIIGGKQFTFTTGSSQVIAGTTELSGTTGNPILLRSSSPGSQWDIQFAVGQSVNLIDVQDSNALVNNITCYNCINSGNNSAQWVFANLDILYPEANKTVNLNPTIIGRALPGATVVIRSINSLTDDAVSNPPVATATADSNGNFMVRLGDDDATTGLTLVPLTDSTVIVGLRPWAGSIGGAQTYNLTIDSTAGTTLIPNITSPAPLERIRTSLPTIGGNGALSMPVLIKSKNKESGVLEDVASGTTNGSGAYSIQLSTALHHGYSYITTIVNGVASNILTAVLLDPYGVVFDSSSSQAIKKATVTIFRADGTPAVAGVDLDAADINPVETDETGEYGFLAAPATYYMTVTADNYVYPSQLTTFPSGRAITTGSKGEQFTVATTVLNIDHPVDGTGFLIRLEKTANKTEVHVGDVVTYTIFIKNLSINILKSFIIEDKIPPGFKYLPNRVLLDEAAITDPSGQRPLLFEIPAGLAPGQERKLKYQLVVGAGVTQGKYENVAFARYPNSSIIISNRTTKTVKVAIDPLFDMGTVIGKTFWDLNENGKQDAPEYDPTERETIIEKPVANVQIVTDDGVVITTDRDGKFSLNGILPGRHIFRLDERTLPEGAFLTTDKAVIVDITPGLIAKVNFGVNMDNTQVVGRDAQFFNEKIAVTQVKDRPTPRLNAALFGEDIPVYEGLFVRPSEFRFFSNYTPFIDTWHLDIMDADTKKLVKRFEGNRFNFNDPVYWNGRDSEEKIIRTDRTYSYQLTVANSKGQKDTTTERPLTLRLMKDLDEFNKEKELTKEALKERAEKYSKWIELAGNDNTLNAQMITIEGETLKINRQGQDVKAVRILKDGQLLAEIPVSRAYGLTPQELLAGGLPKEKQQDNLEVVLPSGDYTMEVISSQDMTAPQLESPDNVPTGVAPVPSLLPNPTTAPVQGLQRYSRKIKVGDDYFMFVALGDATVGYNFNQGNIEPIAVNDRYQSGFYKEGKASYYLKGKVKGKYLITSSFDTEREKKALFRELDSETYYPIYGDDSAVNYDATNTRGPLYLLVEWDKSQAIWGNYAVDFKDNEFAQFSRSFYGGKVDYQSLANNPYGDPRTKMVVFHAEIQERPAHNELLATGGSLYFLKHKRLVEGSDKITLEVRDKFTGLPVKTLELRNGADYELDNDQGRILFWQPVSMIAKDLSIINTSDLANGNPIYIIADYQYEVTDKIRESSEGARLAQGVGKDLVVGTTLIKETQADRDFTLQGADALLHVGENAKVKVEAAQTESRGASAYISTDGGITFTDLTTKTIEEGLAYGITGDARLFDRLGVTSYYKWVDNDFAGPNSVSSQGKESTGLALTFDITPVTRLTVRRDLQKLIQSGNIQTEVQVGANETTVTMVQIAHDAQRLRLTGEYQLTEVKDKTNDVESHTNQENAVIGGKAEFDVTDRVTLALTQQVDVKDKTKNVTTAGVEARVTDKVTVRAQETFPKDQSAITVGATTQVTDRTAITTDYTIGHAKGGEDITTKSVGVNQKVSENLTATSQVSISDSNLSGQSSTAVMGAKANVNETTSLETTIGRAANADGQSRDTVALSASSQLDKETGVKTTVAMNADQTAQQTNSIALEATRNVDEKTQSSSTVKIDETALGNQTTTLSFANKNKVTDEVGLVAERSFGFGDEGTKNNNKYALVREKDGRSLEGSLTRSNADEVAGVSRSNIFGLTGDVNDRLALQGTVEKGKVQNLDKTQTDRMVFSLGSGYVYKDTETAVERFKNSTKVELRLDKSVEDRRQFVFYNALEGKLTDNFSVSAKFDFAKTVNTTTNAIEARHQEIILGAAYRPVTVDNLNLLARYTVKNAQGPQGPLGQEDAQGVEQNKMQVMAVEGIYDLNESWQIAEKFAYRINEEKVAGFEFNKTHTWLMIHRLNYRIDRNWKVGAEYRKLTQIEAQDSKQGFLLEAVRNINDNAELGVGWNFTQFSDDLTKLNYTNQGPFLRMSGKLYDRTPEERARSRARWLDDKINQWAWVMVKKELANSNSRIVSELNTLFTQASIAQHAGRFEESRQMYKDIITAGQMMFDEASEYIRRQIAFEEKLQEYNKTASEYYKGGEYRKARKIWEKIVEDASKRVIQ